MTVIRNASNELTEDTQGHHSPMHEDGGKDEISITELTGTKVVYFKVNGFHYPNPGTDWTPQATGARLAANKAAKVCWIPLNFLKIGDQILGYNLVGDITEVGGDTVTLDCKITRINKADPITETDLAGGGITQVIANGNFDSVATLTNAEVVATDKQYILIITGSTSNVSTTEEIVVMGAEIQIMRLT